MRFTAQFMASLLSLGGLLGMAVSSHATDIAELPLKASVLAKPNVIFAMDDSGSMDWELLLPTANGYVWWNDAAASAWDGVTNRPRASGAANRGLSYLFPMGTGTGGQLYNVGSDFGRAVPPIAQLAWTRSSAFNPTYYNPMAKYPAWSPAYISGPLPTSYSNAATNAAPSHPGPLGGAIRTLNVGSDWNSSSAGFNDDQYAFNVMPGMVLPTGTSVNATTATTQACSGGTRQTLTAPTVATGSCLARIPYFPAAYWQRTVCPAGDTTCVPAPDCVAENPTVNPNASCVASPDGQGKLRRYEIKAGNTFPSGRNYAEELQNFANWFTYYRKRKLLLSGAMGRSLEPITGLRLGVVALCENTGTDPCIAPTMFDADALDFTQNRLAAAGRFYLNALAAQGTPTHAAMNYVASQFNTNTNIVQFACQRNSTVVVTDGFSNTATYPTPSWDAGKSASTWGAAPPFQSIADGSLADHALRHYTNRLRATGGQMLAAGKLPLPKQDPLEPNPNPDLNPDLHITTYGITLGARGTLFPNAVNPFDVKVFDTPPAWPAPIANNPTMIDDLWHATVNGRGRMYLANDAEAMKSSIESAFKAILDQTGAQGGIAVSTVNLPRGDSKAYFGTYNPAGWAGDLTANAIDPKDGTVTLAPTWSASSKLLARDWTTRVIATSDGASGMAFTAAGYVATTVNPGGVYGNDAAVINYLRGDRSGEGTDFRPRTSLIGAIINSEPVVARDDGVVYVASGEGMLHAFDSSAGNPGNELWAFVPSKVLANIGKTTQRGYTFQTQYDGSPVLGKFSAAGKLLVSGMGVAGRGYFALDVSNPRGLNEAGLAGKLKWEFPSAADANKVGQTLGRPVIVKSENNGYVVLLTSGYNNADDGPGRLWMLNADTGAVIKTFTTTASTSDSGLAHVTAFAEPPTGTVRYAYGGDLLGNVWRFDLSDPSATPTPKLLVTLTGPSGAAQPVTAAPELLWNKEKSQRVVMVGTGRLLDIGDFLSTNVQSIYAIADDATLLPLATPRTTLAKQTYVRGATPDLDTLTGPNVNWTTHRGWYIDLPAKEQINTRPTIAYGGLAFVSNSNSGSSCEASSYLYVVDVLSGKKFAGTDFIGTLLSDKSNSSGVTALLTGNQKIVGAGQDGDGKPWSRDITAGSPINPSKNSWIEIRR